MSSLASALPASRAREIVVSAVEATYAHVILVWMQGLFEHCARYFLSPRHASQRTNPGRIRITRRAGTRCRVVPPTSPSYMVGYWFSHTPFRERPCERGGLELAVPYDHTIAFSTNTIQSRH